MDEVDKAFDLIIDYDEFALSRFKSSQKTKLLVTNRCIYCGEIIPPERKAVHPFAQTCIDCETAIEQKNKLYKR
jgi:RNA polymerase-binding transcription factor DksA